MRTNSQNDIIRKGTGDVVADDTVVGERKFSLTATTDKMGITSAGSVAKGFIWGLIIGAAVVMGIGLYANKINLSYSK